MIGDPIVNARDLASKYPFTLDSVQAELARSHTWGRNDDLNVSRWAPFYVGDCGDEVGIAISEGWRLIYGLYDSDVPRVPVDLFCYELHEGPDIALPITQIGGRPWRRDDKPWPRREDGQPLAFIGQIRMTESRDLIPERVHSAVGDFVLLFSDYTWPRFLQYTEDFATISLMEWSRLSDAPSGKPLATELEAVLYPYSFRAHRCRTVEFDKQAGTDYLTKMNAIFSKRAAFKSLNPHDILQYRGTKIGGNSQDPYYYGSEEHFKDYRNGNHILSLSPRLIDAPWFASLGSAYSDFNNAFDEEFEISLGDGGHFNLYTEADGHIHVEECGQG